QRLSGELASDPDKQGLEGELGCQVELLERPPRLPDGPRGALRAHEPLPRRVLPQLRELVQVDRGPIRPDGYGHQVAVPGTDLLELGEELLTLGAARRAAHALLGLAGRQVETG